MIPYNKENVENAKKLRKNMTPEEKHLWYDFLKRLPFTVHRQHNIENYIVDFYIAEKKTVIEVDGRQHLSRVHQKEDAVRDLVLSEWGITVLRFSNESINKEFVRVTNVILSHLGISYNDLKR